MESVCTGVGSAKDNPAWSGYPVKLTFSNMAGENEAAEHVAITQGGKTVMETDCDAPWLLIKAPAGHYDVNASLPGNSGTRMAKRRFLDRRQRRPADRQLAFPAPSGGQCDAGELRNLSWPGLTGPPSRQRQRAMSGSPASSPRP